MKPAIKKANPSGLPFNSHDDALNYARHLVEHSNKWLATNDLNVFQAYTQDRCHIVFEARVGPGPAKYELIIGPVPLRWNLKVNESDRRFNMSSHNVKRYCVDALMFAYPAYFVKSPKGVIPSLVRLEFRKKREEFLREPLTRISYSTGEVFEFSAKGKACTTKFRRLTFNSNRMDGKIKGGTKVFKCISRKINKGSRQRFPSSFEFMDLMNSVRCWLDDKSVWLSVNECLNSPVKITNVRLCMSQPSL